MYAPICLFTYNRLNETQQTIEALQKNFLASESELFIFSDGPKNELNKDKVIAIRQYIHSISGFKSIKIFESEINRGLANSIIHGVTEVMVNSGKIIVLEDDLITSPNFLNFMNQALDVYETNKNIFSISGYTMDLPSLKNCNEDCYTGYRASSWGWGTWIDRWEKVDWNVSEYSNFKWDILQQIRFMRGGSDMPLMLWRQMNNKIDSWAIRWCFHQFKNNLLTIYPTESKVFNIGIGINSTHTKKGNHLNPHNFQFSNKTIFSFEYNIKLDKKILVEFRNVFSIYNRLKNKIIS
jgi:hypothetical protein